MVDQSLQISKFSDALMAETHNPYGFLLMVDHFLMIMIMFIIRALMIMFLDIPTKT